MHNARGFTLLEVMLVLLLMGMISVGVVMTLPNSGGVSQGSEWQAQRFRTLLQLAEDRALTFNAELGIQFNQQSYNFVAYDFSEKKWLPLQDSRINGFVELPDNITAEYSLGDNIWGELSKAQTEQGNNDFVESSYLVNIDGQEQQITYKPQVFIMSSGEVTPFNYQFSNSEQDQYSVTVKVMMSGQIELVEQQ